MIITPKTNVVINGIEYKASTTYNVTYTIYTRMVVAGAMKMPHVANSTVDPEPVELTTAEEKKKPVRKSRRRTTKKEK